MFPCCKAAWRAHSPLSWERSGVSTWAKTGVRPTISSHVCNKSLLCIHACTVTRTTGHEDNSHRQATGIPLDLCALPCRCIHIPFLSSHRNTLSPWEGAVHWVMAEERRRKAGVITKINVALLGNAISCPQSLGLTEGERSGGSKRSSLG